MREEEEASEARTDDCSDEPGSQCMVAITGRRADCPIAVRSKTGGVGTTECFMVGALWIMQQQDGVEAHESPLDATRRRSFESAKLSHPSLDRIHSGRDG